MATKQAAASADLLTKLPIRLRNFFARYPPQRYSAAVRPPPETTTTPASATTTTTTTTDATASTSVAFSESVSESTPLPSPYTPNRDAKGHKRETPATFSAARQLLYPGTPRFPNPFLPHKNFKTGKWFSPRFGLRRQAELVKLAAKYNVEALLPPGKKSTEYKETRRSERGLQIKGTGIGQKVKGHKWERTMEGKLEDRRKAMMEMPELIRLWKQRGHGRGWKKWPKR
ncbi:hypothetical protein BJY04DRAFT_179831 [Aspergillus karnatakaensis]|uniref:mitochondrial 54S ribosomal protein mL59 n=1 Tax=Aspergillus karnatakaensis TaxID=1810916 RepID=UPI003CCDFE09